MQCSPQQCNNSRVINRNHFIRSGSAPQEHMTRSGTVSQFDSSLCTSSTFPYNHGSSAVLTRNESTLRFPYQCNISRDLDLDNSGKRELHSSCFMRSDFHIILKNVQSLFSDQRIVALDVGLDAIRFDICYISETWTRDDEEHFTTPSNHDVFLSGGAPDGHKGVDIIRNPKIRVDITNVKFVAIHC